MQRSHLILVVSIIGLLIIGSIALPFLFAGKPSPLFSIENKDANYHKVVVEITDSNDEYLFKKMYELDPKKGIVQSKPIWLATQLSVPPGSSKDCMIKVTLDDNITETSQENLQLWDTIDVTLFDENEDSPIFIGIISV